FLGRETVPVAVALLLDAAGDLAGQRHLLGGLRRVVGLVVEHHGGTGVGEQVGVGNADGILEAVLEAVLGRRAGAEEAAVGEARQGGGVGWSVDGDGEFFQYTAVNDCRRVGLAPGQVAAPDRDVGGFAVLNNARVDGVDPRGGGDAEPVEVFGRPSGV